MIGEKYYVIKFSIFLKLKVKVSPIYDPYVREVPVREDTCPGLSAL